jgi:hypothetical protein
MKYTSIASRMGKVHTSAILFLFLGLSSSDKSNRYLVDFLKSNIKDITYSFPERLNKLGNIIIL